MTTQRYGKSVLLSELVALSLGGFLFHGRVHPVAQHPSNVIAALSGVLSIIAVPLLFSFKKTLPYGYVLNGFLAILGTLVMGHFALVHWPHPATLRAILLNTTLADILIVWSKFLVGKSLFDLEFYGYDPNKVRKGHPYRYPNLGWWGIHFVAVGIVYTLGHILWR